MVHVVGSYFTNQLTLAKALVTPSIIQQAAKSGAPVAVKDVLAAFGGGENMTAISCGKTDGKTYLDGVFFCYGVDVHGNPTEREPCPALVMSSAYDDSCELGLTQFYIYPSPK
jgi:ribonuclease I